MRAMRARLSPAGSWGRGSSAPPPGKGLRVQRGAVGTAGVRQGRSPAGTRPHISRKVAAPRGGISANCPSANPPANPEGSGGNTGEFRRQQHHQQLAGQVFALLQRGATGKPGSRHRRGEARSRRANKTRQAPSREKGPILRAPRPPAELRPTPGAPRRAGGAPRGHCGEGVGGARRRPQEKEVCSPPPPPTGLRYREAGEPSPTPARPHPAAAPQGQQPPHPCAPRAAPRPLTCRAGRRPAPSPPGAAHPPSLGRARGSGEGSCAAVAGTGARAGRGILRAARCSGARAGESVLSEPRASKPTVTKEKN